MTAPTTKSSSQPTPPGPPTASPPTPVGEKPVAVGAKPSAVAGATDDLLAEIADRAIDRLIAEEGGEGVPLDPPVAENPQLAGELDALYAELTKSDPPSQGSASVSASTAAPPPPAPPTPLVEPTAADPTEQMLDALFAELTQGGPASALPPPPAQSAVSAQPAVAAASEPAHAPPLPSSAPQEVPSDPTLDLALDALFEELNKPVTATPSKQGVIAPPSGHSPTGSAPPAGQAVAGSAALSPQPNNSDAFTIVRDGKWRSKEEPGLGGSFIPEPNANGTDTGPPHAESRSERAIADAETNSEQDSAASEQDSAASEQDSAASEQDSAASEQDSAAQQATATRLEPAATPDLIAGAHPAPPPQSTAPPPPEATAPPVPAPEPVPTPTTAAASESEYDAAKPHVSAAGVASTTWDAPEAGAVPPVPLVLTGGTSPAPAPAASTYRGPPFVEAPDQWTPTVNVLDTLPEVEPRRWRWVTAALEQINRPLASLSPDVRDLIGKVAIVTLFNAAAVLLYVYWVRGG